MYTNIPVKETLQILQEELSSNQDLQKSEIKDILNLTKVTNNHKTILSSTRFIINNVMD